MIKLSRLTDYAIVALSSMAEEGEGKVMAASVLAERTGIPEPTVAKILKILVRGGIITSVRGVSGGYRLERKPADLPVSDIIAAMEGPITLTACVDGSGESCALEGHCTLKGRWTAVNDAIKGALDKVSLADMGAAH